MGFMCIAPVLAAKLIPNARLTLGFSNEAQEKIDALGEKEFKRTLMMLL